MPSGPCVDSFGSTPRTGDGHAEPYIVRRSRKAIEIGLPCCPCGQEMVLDDPGEEEEDSE
jgi:hypothetical protein